MNQITLSFSDKTEMFHFLENIGHAQKLIADYSERDKSSPEDLFAIMALAEINIQANKQMASIEMESEREKSKLNDPKH